MQVLSERYVSKTYMYLDNLFIYEIYSVLLQYLSLCPQCHRREESLLQEIQPEELHERMQDPSFVEDAQLIDVREPDEVYSLILVYCFLLAGKFHIKFSSSVMNSY